MRVNTDAINKKEPMTERQRKQRTANIMTLVELAAYIAYFVFLEFILWIWTHHWHIGVWLRVNLTLFAVAVFPIILMIIHDISNTADNEVPINDGTRIL